MTLPKIGARSDPQRLVDRDAYCDRGNAEDSKLRLRYPVTARPMTDRERARYQQWKRK